MSRIGKKAVAIPAGVTATINDRILVVKGPKGELSMPLVDDISYTIEAAEIAVLPASDTKRARYRASVQGANLKLQLGYSHDVDFAIPDGITIKTPDPTTVEITGSDKQRVGQVAAEIRRWRKPEPYKGKGIKYRGEVIFRKEGKKK
ncbi:MAG: 50S ribosomal protein L6 [Sphingomonadales bacterium 12-62-5]|nr:MAG: 50S ribosomal protein L6 [Sphingomonadales bacterium 12-62-5]